MSRGIQDREKDKVVFLVARAPGRADGVRDHAATLASALRQRGVPVDVISIDWRREGWTRAALRITGALRNDTTHVVIHYSQLAWSRRGLPTGIVAVAALSRLFCRGTVWVHDPDRLGLTRSRHRAASLAKGVGLRLAIRLTGSGVTPVHPSRVFWATDRIQPRLLFCPTPSTIGSAASEPPVDKFTVSFFGMSAVNDPAERAGILEIVDLLRAQVEQVRVRVLGSAPADVAAALESQLRKMDVDADVPGHLPHEELCKKLAASHAFVVVREPLSTRKSTIGAAIACGVPVVGFDGTETGPPLHQAGVVAVREGDRAAIVDNLVRIEQSVDLRAALSKRSIEVAEHTLNWDVTAERVHELLAKLRPSRLPNDCAH